MNEAIDNQIKALYNDNVTMSAKDRLEMVSILLLQIAGGK